MRYKNKVCYTYVYERQDQTGNDCALAKNERKQSMSYFDPDIYNIENLKDEDKKRVNEIEYIREQVLGDSAIDEYLSEHGSGKVTNELMKEMFVPFVDNLRENIDCCICDMIVDAIDGYTEEEFERMRTRAKKEEVLQIDN